MLIKSESNLSRRAQAWSAAKSTMRLTSVRLVVALAGVVVLLYAGVVLYKLEWLPFEWLKSVARDITYTGRYAMAHLSAPPQTLWVDIGFKDYQELLKQRQRALARGMVLPADRVFVPARIRAGNRTLRAKVRIKGDLIDHLDSDKWSLRVELKGRDRFRGMRKFSLQHPKTRKYVNEWVYAEAMRREGIMTPRYDFVDVRVNGRPKGIYAFEEAFSQEFMELHHKRETVIVRMDESLFWLEASLFGFNRSLGVNWQSSKIDCFDTKKVMADDKRRRLFGAARTLLDRFRRGELSTSQAFDTKLYARYLALCDLLGSWHGSAWHNMRYYYNAVTSKLEPIAYDGDAGQSIELVLGIAGSIGNRLWYGHTTHPGDAAGSLGPRDTLHRALFQDMDFYRAYIQELERVSSDAYIDGLIEALRPGLKAKLRLLHREWPSVDFDAGILRVNQRMIRSVLNAPVMIDAYAYNLSAKPGKPLRVRGGIGNLLSVPVEVVGMKANSHSLRVPETLSVLPARLSSQRIRYQSFDMELPAPSPTDPPDVVLTILYRVIGASDIREQQVEERRLVDLAMAPPGNAATLERLRTSAFAAVDEAHKTIRLRPGTWSIEGDLVAPAGYTLEAGPGTTLRFAKGKVLLSYSPVAFNGSADKPVNLEPQKDQWGGLVVLNAGGPSKLTWTTIRRANRVDRGLWTLTGGVTFYRSPVTLTNCRIEHALGEDGINFVKSPFDMRNTCVTDAASDALDSDFSDGRVLQCTFERPGNDGIDVSGSKVSIDRVVLTGCGDKGISAGEGSTVLARRVTIEASAIGAASKDASTLVLRGATLRHNKVAFAAYQKKPWFGPATLEATDVVAENNSRLALVERRSKVTLNGILHAGTQKNVAKMLEAGLEAPK